MNACNRFGESLMHLACRRANYDVVHYILTHGGDPCAVDDFGRTPLHDAFWRSEPRFDIVAILLKYNPQLIQAMDVRGSLALNYISSENWSSWCAFFFHMREKYWPPRIIFGLPDPSELEKPL